MKEDQLTQRQAEVLAFFKETLKKAAEIRLKSKKGRAAVCEYIAKKYFGDNHT